MKKLIALLLTVITLLSVASVALAEETSPKYSAVATFDADEMLLEGSVSHIVGTPEVDRLYVRITYFMADGTFTVVPAVVWDDGSFECMFSGSVVHISVFVVDRAKVLPGTYTRFGKYDFDVK